MSDQIMLNWGRDQIFQDDLGVRLAAKKGAADLAAQGFTASQALDVLIAKGMEIRLAEAAVAENFRQPALPPRVAAAPKQVIPTSYKDVAPLVEAALRTMSPEEFVDTLASGENAVLRVSEKTLHSFYRLAAMAQEEPRALRELHKSLSPWMEEAMYASVLAARSGQPVRFAQTSAAGFTITDPPSHSEVNMAQGNCSCERFQQGRFAKFGLACEHLVMVADKVAPTQRLVRDEDEETDPCWNGYHKVPGKSDYSDDSCEKNAFH